MTATNRIMALAERRGPHCAWCRRRVTLPTGRREARGLYRATLDHVVPLSRGGSDDDSNVVLACAPCNHAKADHLVGVGWEPVKGCPGGRRL